MSVVLFDSVITAYMENSPGLKENIERRAQAVVEEARSNVRIIMHRVPGVAQDVNYVMEGTTAVIGIDINAGSIAEYLDEKVFQEGGSWLRGTGSGPLIDPLEAARDA